MRHISLKALLPSLVLLSSCGGEEDICQRAYKIKTTVIRQMCEFAEGRDDCNYLCPCQCLEQGREMEYVEDERGLPDLDESVCDYKEECEGNALEDAETCLEDVEKCKQLGASAFDEEFNWMGVPFCGPDSPLTFKVEDCPGL